MTKEVLCDGDIHKLNTKYHCSGSAPLMYSGQAVKAGALPPFFLKSSISSYILLILSSRLFSVHQDVRFLIWSIIIVHNAANDGDVIHIMHNRVLLMSRSAVIGAVSLGRGWARSPGGLQRSLLKWRCDYKSVIPWVCLWGSQISSGNILYSSPECFSSFMGEIVLNAEQKSTNSNAADKDGVSHMLDTEVFTDIPPYYRAASFPFPHYTAKYLYFSDVTSSFIYVYFLWVAQEDYIHNFIIKCNHCIIVLLNLE